MFDRKTKFLTNELSMLHTHVMESFEKIDQRFNDLQELFGQSLHQTRQGLIRQQDNIIQSFKEPTKDFADLQGYTKTEIARLTRDLSSLHDLVTRRLSAQIEYLHHEIRNLKQHVYQTPSPASAKAFNGQFSKHAIFRDLQSAFSFEAFVETGTYLGSTALFLSTQGKPVYTVEIQETYYRRAEEILKEFPDVRISHGDSPEFLQKIVQDVLPPKSLAFFYLDAHWYDHLPLREELAIIATRHPRAIVMIDDFKVEDDPGYGYDIYDKGQDISLSFLKEELTRNRWQVFFPRMPSAQDHMTTDILPPRGTAVLACDPALVTTLKQVASLRFWPL